MAKIRLTKNELRKQKEALKRYEQFLPTLQLKKQQLQMETEHLRQQIKELIKKKERTEADIKTWVDVFAEEVGLEELLSLKEIKTGKGNIAGVDMPVYEEIVFEEKEYDLFGTPLWVDAGVEALKKFLELMARMDVLKEQKEKLEEELRTTTQRVNLFEKLMIPETKENIRRIEIYLGDQQTARVVTGKIAKKKIEKKKQEA